MKKAELRKSFLEQRSALSLSDAAARSRSIADKFFRTTDLNEISLLSTFIRIARFNEIDTSMIYYRIWRDHPKIRTVAPVMDTTANLIESVEFGPASELVENNWGIREPVGEVVSPGEVDLVLVPLLCVDGTGHRVGYGKGFYDRFLSSVSERCVKIGLSYFPPVVSIDDAGVHDVRLDACITPDEVIRFSPQEYL